MTIDQLNRLSEEEAELALEQCCGSSQWIEGMVYARPFEDLGEVLDTSERIWEECDVDDYEEAFSYHPRLGNAQDMAALKQAGNGVEDLGLRWAASELRNLESATPEELEELARVSEAYEDRFQFALVVHATGKSAAELLAIVKGRMANDHEEEIRLAAEEQEQITRARLKKLMA